MAHVSRVVLTVLLLLALPLTAHGWTRTRAETFARLPRGAANPEGITVDARGNVYVTTFAVRGTSSGTGQLFVFDSRGHLRRQVDVEGSSPLLLDLAFHPKTGQLLVIDFGKQQVLDVNPVNGKSKLFTTIPGGTAAGPNVLTFDRAGNVYISDSFQGVIWRTGRDGGAPQPWIISDLLKTTGVPPFGANGLAFNNKQTALFVANTGNDQVIKIEVTGTRWDPRPGPVAVFVNSINGADGLIIDDDDNLWVAANQADEIVVLNSSGRVIAKLGDFGGLDEDGAPIGLLFPASLVRHRGFLYVTNLALDLRLFGLAQPVDAQWAAAVVVHTIARIRATLPPVPGLSGERDSDEHDSEERDSD